MQNISLIVCPNGYGHIRRSIYIYNLFTECMHSVKIYTDKKQFFKYLESKNIPDNFNLVDCPWMPKANDYKNGNFYLNEFQNLSEVTKNTLVISDNYLEPFLFNSRGIVMANFFFHEEVLNRNDEHFKLLENFSWRNMDLVTSFFSMPYMQKYNVKYNIPLIGEQSEQSEDLNYIILTKGMGCWSKDFDDILIRYLRKNLTNFSGTIILDQTLIDKREEIEFFGLNIDVKPFNKQLISGAKVIIGRPSVGILTESLQYRIPFIPLIGSDDQESNNNSSILKNLYNEIGINIKNIHDARVVLKNATLPLDGQKDMLKIISEKFIR